MPQLTLPGYDSNPLNGADFTVLDLQIGAPTANAVTTIPTSLITHIIPQDGTQDITRQLTFNTQQNIVGPFTINGSTFDMSVINYTVPLGNREIWSLTNQTPIAHPFHIHDVQFYILDINGTPPPPELSGLNDVVLVPAGMGNVRFIADFLDHANDTIPYMYHCHMLTHEDEGMMGQFIVSDASSGISENQQFSVQISPNPTGGMLTVECENIDNASFFVIDISGKRMPALAQKASASSVELDLGSFAAGMYFIEVEVDGLKAVQRVEKL